MSKKKKEVKEENKEEVVSEVKVPEEKDKAVQISFHESTDQLNEFIKSKIEKEVRIEVGKEVKKIIRNKNIIIIKRDIIILILLVCCFFLGYNLCNISDIKIDISKSSKSEVKKEKKVSEIKEDKTSKLEENKIKYGEVLDNIYICENSDYLEDYYEGNLTDELKLYLAYNNLEDDKIILEDNTTYVNSEDLKESFEDIIDGEYSAKSFKWGADSFKYLSSKELYIYDGYYEKSKCNIKKEIIDIDDKDDLVVKTVEGKIIKGKLYNVLTDKEIKDYKDNLSDYKDSLTEVSYTFKRVDDKYKLFKIEKNV